MHQENRRSFVKKSLATTVSISFAGLIRAHGEEGGGTTTWNPDETTIETTDSGGTTTWNPDESTTLMTTAETTVGTTSPKYYIWGQPPGATGSTDGYSQIIKQYGASGYYLKLKMWCEPDFRSFTKLSLKATGEFYGNGNIFTIPDPKLEFSGDKKTPEAYEFPDGQPKLENSIRTITGIWYTGTSGTSNFRKHEIVLVIDGTRNDPVPQEYIPRFVTKVKLTGTLNHYEPGTGTSSWTLIDSASEELETSLELTILPEIM